MQRHRALLTALRQIDKLLEWEGETHWHNWINECIDLIEGGYPSGIEHLLKAYGGMGSINDLILGFIPPNSWREGSTEINEKLSTLLSEAYDLARKIERDDSAGA